MSRTSLPRKPRIALYYGESDLDEHPYEIELGDEVEFHHMTTIGFGAAAVQWFTSAEEEAASLADTISHLRDVENGLRETHDILKMSLPELYEKYGRYALLVREATLALLEHQAAEARIALADSFTAAEAKVVAYTDAVGRGVVAMAHELGVSVGEAQRLQAAFQKMRDAASFEDRVVALRELEAAMAAAGVSSEQLPREIRAALVEGAKAVQTMASLAKTTEDAEAAAHRLAGAGPRAGWLAGAIGDAAALAGRLWNAYAASAAIRSGAIPGKGPSFEEGGRSGSTLAPYVPPAKTLDELITENAAGTSGGGGGGGGRGRKSEIERQREALADLRAEEERHIELLRTTDPVQRLILENHKALAGATQEEKDEVVALILERQRLEEIRDQVEELGQTGSQAFKGLISGAHSFSDALAMVIDKLADMLASGAWDLLWSGGDSGWGGLGGIVGGWLGLADGGMVTGPGGPRDDAVPAWLSNGEYVVNAMATQRNLPLLEALNGGASLSDLLSSLHGHRPIALADGGYIGELTGSRAPAAWAQASAGLGGGGGGGAGGKMEIGLRLFWDRKKGDWAAEVAGIARSEAEGVFGAGIDAWSAHVLPGRIQEVDAHPRVYG